MKDALDFFGDGPSISSSNNSRVEQASQDPWPVTDAKKRSRKRKRRASAASDLENASPAESGMNDIIAIFNPNHVHVYVYGHSGIIRFRGGTS